MERHFYAMRRQVHRCQASFPWNPQKVKLTIAPWYRLVECSYRDFRSIRGLFSQCRGDDSTVFRAAAPVLRSRISSGISTSAAKTSWGSPTLMRTKPWPSSSLTTPRPPSRIPPILSVSRFPPRDFFHTLTPPCKNYEHTKTFVPVPKPSCDGGFASAGSAC